MVRRFAMSAVALSVAFAIAGCQSPGWNQVRSGWKQAQADWAQATEILPDHHHGQSYNRTFLFMADNGMWKNMAIADNHFVAHTTEISGAGEARLDRMAYMLNVYGGTLRYETNETDETLVNHRLQHVREYLALAGCDTSRVVVTPMISGGSRTPARDILNNSTKKTGQSTERDANIGQTMSSFGGARGSAGG